ncbi:hypothetical protein [Brevibacillus parabrevis]|jgi:hypothetical protein|uniref:hypothetical protein n=1 Tax=Brevibacillus parabrevis TaxID=54914 RepID=UPI002493B798|nr:hypothetical protein [Brevibacillus parabrevis]
MASDRRTVYFNLDDVIEKEMYELSGSLNFSGWVKERLKPLALARIAERQATSEPKRMGIGTPVPVRRAVAADVQKA